VDCETVAAGPVEIRGYAFAGGERHVARVDVSVDGGANWSQAELLEDLGRWAWRHWRATLALASGEHEIVVRAWDSSAATQPEDEAALWNPKSYEQCPPAGAGAGRLARHARGCHLHQDAGLEAVWGKRERRPTQPLGDILHRIDVKRRRPRLRGRSQASLPPGFRTENEGGA
jgi:hypothetical protein